MKATAYLHPFVFAIASVVYIYPSTCMMASPDQAIRTLLVLWSILALLIYPAYLLTRSAVWSGVLLSGLVLAVFSPEVICRFGLIQIGLAILLVFLYARIRKVPFGSVRLALILNLVSAISVTALTLEVWHQAPAISIFDTPQYRWKNRSIPDIPSGAKVKPDIYYIVLDGYARADVLNEYYGYDNSEFIKALSKRGFIVPNHARSNYPRTVLSISSTLNMDYVSNLAPELTDKNVPYWWLFQPLINHSRVRQMLEKIGYHSYSLASGWGPTDNKTTDNYYKPAPVVLNDFEIGFLAATPMRLFSGLLGRFAYIPSYDAYRKLVLFQFATLPQLAKEAGPKFVFSHIIAPHPPFVFDENVKSLTPDYGFSFNDANDIDLTRERYRSGYVSQLKFVNKKIVQLVDEILKNSKSPPIILLQADHGPGMWTDFASYSKTCLRERFSIFAAYYLPGLDPGVVPDDVIPVNLFRILFNQYFDAKFAQLSRHHYFPRDADCMFSYNDITKLADKCR